MVSKDFKVEDLVWAKMKSYPFWPARIASAPAESKPRKGCHYVRFFGTNDHAWILDESIVPHSDEQVHSASSKKKSALFQSAIDEIVDESKNKPKKNKSPVKEKSEKEDKELPKKSPQITNSSEKKAVKVAKSSSTLPKKEERVPKKKKLQLSDEAAVNHHSSPPNKKQKKDNFADLAKNVPPNFGYSRVAVIPPYDDSLIHQSSGILARPDYVDRPPTPCLDLSNVSESLKAKNIKPTLKKIGFLGLGMMGQRMVKNLLNSGHDVTIWNRSPEKCIDFIKAGAHKAQTPGDVVSSCEITFCCVSDPHAVKSLVFGNCGILAGLEGCGVGTKGYVEMTSIEPVLSQEIAEAISSKGGKYLEAPVSGSRQLAEEGALLILAAGDRQLFNECETCFYALSKNAYYLSCDIGSGFKMSLILSALMGTSCAALAEAMALIERSKLSQSNFLEILGLGPLSCPLLNEKGQSMVVRNFETNTALKHQQKDLNMALAIGHLCEQPMPITSAANELFKHAKLLRYSDHDVSAVLLGAKY